MMVPVVSIVGLSGSGKTTLLEKVITELKKRGYRVAALKHDAHGFEIDYEGKDSFRHGKAGASAIALSSPRKFAVIKKVAKEWPPERLISSFLADADVVITEGYKKGRFPKIEVVRKGVSAAPVASVKDGLIAVASDMRIKAGVPVYGIDDFRSIASLIEREIIRKHVRKTVSLVVDGRDVELKPFIEDLMREAVFGMVRSLKGCKNPGEINLKARKR